ncbi:amidohydrolase [Fodinicola acaciae]|uniref:amidohydrolase n=1 Tax=Fodinicola acaciae TaxID=2681555 RepID=UPI0013CFD36B|nr:amidohydrolase [Fodinicola acaciae]
MSTLYRHGIIRTTGGPASAVLVADGRIAWLGTDSADISADTVVDLNGAYVLPAFVDGHVHATATGLALGGLDLTGVPSLAAMLAAVRAHAERLPRDAVLLGHGWDESRWTDRRPPTAAELDVAAGGRPAYLSRTDVHSAVASTALLREITPSSKGFAASGHLTVDAHHAARAIAYASVTADQRRAAQRLTLQRAASLGIAALHECGGPDIAGEDDFTELLGLAGNEPGPAVFGYWGELGEAAKARELGAIGAGGDLFADGAIGSHTAALSCDYLDSAGRGHAYLSAEQVRDHVLDCASLGLSAGFHAIGDAAVGAVVCGFGYAAEKVGAAAIRAGRHRIEHAEMVDDTAIARMAELGIIASVQPAFDAAWGGPAGMYAERLGADRAATLNPFAALHNAGVRLVLGSDSPVTPIDPWAGVRAAVEHRTAEHGLTWRAAYDAHTRSGWRAVGQDGGAIAVGAPAHLAMFRAESDPYGDLQEPPDCVRTLVGGAVIHAA